MRLLEIRNSQIYSRVKNMLIYKPVCQVLQNGRARGLEPPHFLKKFFKEKKKEREREKISDLPQCHKICSSDRN